MKIRAMGTRGSIAISNPNILKYGGNTTCLGIESDCLPKGQALGVDMGSGYVPYSGSQLKQGVLHINVCVTHWHHDHTVGLPMAPHTHAPPCKTTIWGPAEHGVGGKQVARTLMKAPFFPVDFKKIEHKFKFVDLQHIGTQVIVVHPKGGFKLFNVHEFEEMVQSGPAVQLPFGKRKFFLEECLVIRMLKTTHPEYTVSFRFEEKPTGQVFVFLTDHENTDGMPLDLVRHVSGADLLIQDGQYARTVYEKMTAGWGHGTPDYCARLAATGKVKRLGLTHHDPNATDADVDQRVQDARDWLIEHDHPALAANTFGCADYQLFDLSEPLMQVEESVENRATA